MMIRGRFIGDAPYFAVHIQSVHFHGLVWLLADTGASRTTILDRDVRLLGIAAEALEPAGLPRKTQLLRFIRDLICGGDSISSFLAKRERRGG